jgi:hypothetical protein
MVPSSIINQLRRLRADQRGAVSITMGLMMIPLVGFLALGFEVSNWYLITRSMQNAADASALAAAINNSANYDVEARAVAAQYGFVNGVNNVLIGVSNTATCPITGDTNCYSVTISGYTPLLMSQIVGFQGAGNINGSLQKQLGALAVAKAASPAEICMLALAKSGTNPAIHTNGAPTANMNGCDSMSYTGADCNGHNLGIGISFTVGSTNNGCGAKKLSNQSQLNPPDPYKSQIQNNISNFNLATNNPCTGAPPYPQETFQGNHASGGTARTGTISLPSGNTFWCGDQRLTGDVTIETPATGGAVLVIINGQLDLEQHNFITDTTCKPPTVVPPCSSGLTIVFTGDNSPGYTYGPTDNAGPGGTLDITPPTTGPWAGMAIVQDPSLTNGVDIASAGNSPTLNITGLIYTPHATITLKGAINKSTNGAKCVVMVADNFQISGTGGIDKSDIGNCKGAGLTVPTANVGAVGLVL